MFRWIERNRPRAPTEGRSRKVEGKTASHLRLKLALEANGIRENSLSVLLLLLHIDIHVSHGHLIIEAWHPTVGIFPCRIVDWEGLWLLWGLWRRGWDRWCWGSRRLVLAILKEAADERGMWAMAEEPQGVREQHFRRTSLTEGVLLSGGLPKMFGYKILLTS